MTRGFHERPLVFGHRGAAAERPENTLPSFARAVELGVDVLETDVHRTRDGALVLSHDADLRRQADRDLVIRDATLAELRACDVGWGFVDGGARPYAGRALYAPTLSEALAAFPGVRFNVDIKQSAPRIEEDVVRTVTAAGAADRVLLASFDVETLERVRALGYPGPTAVSKRDVQRLWALPWFALSRARVDGARAQVPVRAGVASLASRRFLQRCHDKGIAVDFWVINDAAQARALIELGADGVMTDDPLRVRPAVA